MSKFSEYVTSNSFCLTLTKAQINAFIWHLTHDPRYDDPLPQSLYSLERRGLIEWAGLDEWRTTVAGWKVYDLIKLSGLIDNRDIFPREWQIEEHIEKLDRHFS